MLLSPRNPKLCLRPLHTVSATDTWELGPPFHSKYANGSIHKYTIFLGNSWLGIRMRYFMRYFPSGGTIPDPVCPEIFWLPSIISGTGKATNFKCCTHFHTIDRNKSPLKIGESSQGLPKIFTAFIYRACFQLSFLDLL